MLSLRPTKVMEEFKHQARLWDYRNKNCAFTEILCEVKVFV